MSEVRLSSYARSSLFQNRTEVLIRHHHNLLSLCDQLCLRVKRVRWQFEVDLI